MTAPAAEYPEESAELSEPSTADAPNSDVPVTSEEGGVLILGGTPIGNLADASDRLRSALATADLIAVEDTRKLRTLASGLGVRTRGRVIVNHDHNEEGRSATIVQAVQDGQRVLLLSDAGMPTISDPGYVAAAAVAEADLPVTVVPGPSAALTALALSGLPTGRFTFEGFLARKGSERSRRLASLAGEERTMIFYESPHRTAATLADFVQTFGADRRGTVSRELTKLHEEVRRGTLAELAEWAESERIRGEIVIIVEGAQAPETPEAQDIVQLVLDRVAAGERLKAACAAVAAETGTSKRELYEAALAARSE
ncbi:MAG: 16S rRNA (cytidine(1402)-2'-O)-methyltransferase [Rothia sp.]|uniref:16S rRNA (cytidine(1402)-2'-O)-methyltransferase n=1 Tax=Rothia sp. (in: high G+C Gram-positive bacteria) TaxID=1885016 RepID=UPI001CB12A47|nr:16S rRNA (cytidine(1402)-2'-O)-methyltransferase [Rothia sp. (in: high G+C Gram-positive bacteria)]MBF1676462.1 16S rRNA (cytidine(1402)-2'-O)-methyltransferase [Rothia sp. (in: high G+C Gram-positive bacteria)]